MGMRQALLDSTGRTKFIGAFERDAADTLLRSLHGLVWLRGERQPLRPPEVVDHAERQFKQKLPGLRKALDDNAYLGWKEFDELYRDVESLGEMINAG
jgi:cytochrome c peroxidase